jgi:putative ABC transport system permease protein
LKRLDSLLIVAILAVGTAAATAIFSIYDQVFLRPLPYPAPHEIVSLRRVGTEHSIWTGVRITEGQIPDGVFRSTGLVQPAGVNVTVDGATFRAPAAVVNAGFFQVMGVSPVAGRIFTRDEEQDSRVAVVSEHLWLGRLRGSRDLRDATVVINGREFDVVGVMPRGFDYPEGSEIWLPLRADRQAPGALFFPGPIARLAEGVTIGTAELQMRQSAGRPMSPSTRFVAPLGEIVHRDVAPLVRLLALVTGLLLVASVAAVATLWLSRCAGRSHEFAVRRALGAGPWHITRLVFSSFAPLVAAGGVLGFIGALGILHWVTYWLTHTAPGVLAGAEPPVDLRFLLLTLGVILAVALGSLVGTASSARGESVSLVLGRGSGGGPHRGRLDSALVIAQLAVSVALAAAAATVLKTARELAAIDTGLGNHSAVLFDVTPPEERYPRVEGLLRYVAQAEEAGRQWGGGAVVGASSVALGNNRPVRALSLSQPSAPERHESPIRTAVSPGYFEALGIPLLAGRSFTDADLRRPDILILSASVAASFGAHPAEMVGRQLTMGRTREDRHRRVAEVIGVVGDARIFGPAFPTVMAYVPLGAEDYRPAVLTLTVGGGSPVPGAGVQAIAAAADPQVPAFNVTTPDEIAVRSLAPERVTLAATILFSAAALVMAVLAVHGVLRSLVNARRHELAIRLALGAPAAHVRGIVLVHTAVLTVAGLMAGALLAWWLWRAGSSLLPTLQPPSPAGLLVATAVLVAVALASALLPARAATRVDPIAALKSQ